MATLATKKINRNLDVSGDLEVTGSLSVGGDSITYAVVYAGSHTTAGGAVSEDITLSGVLSSDLVFAQLANEGTNKATLSVAKSGVDKISLTFALDPGNDEVVSYQVLRAI